MVISVNTETEHLLDHQELVFCGWYQAPAMFLAYLYSKDLKHQECCQVLSTSNNNLK